MPPQPVDFAVSCNRCRGAKKFWLDYPRRRKTIGRLLAPLGEITVRL